MDAVSRHKISGPHAERYEAYIQHKAALGYKTSSSKLSILRKIAIAMEEHRPPEDAAVLPKDAVLKWIEPIGDEKPGTRHNRCSAIRDLGVFLQGEGLDAYVLPSKIAGRLHSDFDPRILSEAEVAAIAEAVDQTPHDKKDPLKTHEYALLFRVLYGTGLRISEALNLLVADVDLENELLVVRHAKEEKSRIAPYSQSLSDCLRSYLEQTGLGDSPKSHLFPSRSPNNTSGRIDRNTARCNLQKAFSKAGVKTSEGKPPRVHDVRHSFVCASYDAARRRGENPHALVPVLSTYVGHESIETTMKYLHLTEDSWRYMAETSDRLNSELFREVGGDEL